MSILRQSIFAGLTFAAITTGWDVFNDDPWRGSYVLGFAFRAVLFGIIWFVCDWLMLRHKKAK